MARCPIAIALVKLNRYQAELLASGKVSDLWHLTNNEVRRNIMYCENLDPEWYNSAIQYTINRIITHESK